jgi:hypothetical protein
MLHEGGTLIMALATKKTLVLEVCAFSSTKLQQGGCHETVCELFSGVIFVVMAIGLTPAHAKIIGKNVEYTADGVT